MSTKPFGSAIKPLPTVLDVEKSRAERLQRQQARFRDRGGIFVPSNRNILADILLGRAAPRHSPRKSRSRSLSCSPKRHGGKATGVSVIDKRGQQVQSSTSATRRSPRKAKASIKERPVSAGPSRVGQISAPKKSLASKGKRKASDPIINEDAPIKKPRGRPSKKEVPHEDEAKPADKTTSTRGRKTATAKPSTSQKKGKTKLVEAPDVVECGESDVEPHGKSKPKPRTRKTSKPAASPSKDSTVADSNAKAKAKRKPAATVHATPTDPTKRTRLKKPIGVYAELSEDDNDLPQPPPKKSVKPTPKSKQLVLASDGDPDPQATLPILSKRKAHKKPLSVIEEEEDEDPYYDNGEPGPKKGGRKDAPAESKKRTFNQTTHGTFDANDYSPRKRCKTVARAELETAGKSSKSASPVKEDIDTSLDPNNTSNPHKRAKAIRGKPRTRKADAVAQENVPKNETIARKITKRKKTGVQEIVERPYKKPKVDTKRINRNETPESELAAHISGGQTKTKKMNTSKKENILVRDLPKPSKNPKVSTEVSLMRGPPKSVLQRIQKAAPRKHDDDNEPDPIDFLS